MATLILVTIESGRLDEAELRFKEWEGRLRADDGERLRRKLGWGLTERGELDRAAAILEGDSSIGTEAVLGWVRLYQGDLAAAMELFRAAGPFALSREEATRRTSMIALMQRVRSDSVPDLGEALLWLAQGDTARSVAGLSEAARNLPVDGGQADLLALAGDLARAAHDYGRAERLLLEALVADSLGPAAPVAEYALAVVLEETDRTDLAVDRLEHLILSHAASAVVPEARRMLNRLQGAIPQS
jgi:tetratricopeptide (TPR) repeat protein